MVATSLQALWYSTVTQYLEAHRLYETEILYYKAKISMHE